MAYSFRGHPFLAARPGDAWMPTAPPPERVEDRAHIPYSDINIVDDGGDGLRVWQLTIYCTASERAAILADRGQVGSLVTPDETLPNTKLSQVRSASVLVDRSLYSLECEFVVS